MGDIYTKGQTRTKYNKVGKIEPAKLRPEDVIRDDLHGQLEKIFARWEQWKCQA